MGLTIFHGIIPTFTLNVGTSENIPWNISQSHIIMLWIWMMLWKAWHEGSFDTLFDTFKYQIGKIRYPVCLHAQIIGNYCKSDGFVHVLRCIYIQVPDEFVCIWEESGMGPNRAFPISCRTKPSLLLWPPLASCADCKNLVASWQYIK